jgi:hypothetical protein
MAFLNYSICNLYVTWYMVYTIWYMVYSIRYSIVQRSVASWYHTTPMWEEVTKHIAN